MNLPDQFIAYIDRQHLFSRNNRLLVAVSGGVDSVVLCHLCKAAGFDFAIAHCNFQLRGEHSTRDEDFVRGWSGQLGVPFYSVQFNTTQYAAAHKLSTQVAARDLRYNWFEKIRQERGYDFIVTAHHADDAIETLLMNFFRGTGIHGLTGIQPVYRKIRRPLLFAKRTDLECYLDEHHLSFVQDDSNLKDDYTRNYFRNSILPMIAKVYPEVQQNLSENIQRFKEVETLYQQEILRLIKKLVTKKGEDVYIPVLLLQKTPAMRTVLLELIKPYDFKATQLEEVEHLLNSRSGKYMVSTSHRILKDRKHLVISPLKETGKAAIVIEGPGQFHFVNGILGLSQSDAVTPGNDEQVALLDANLIQYPLLLRPWRQGDYFYPLGMKGKKKLSKFFVDKKMSLADKEKVWVVEMNRKIIWVVSYRIDDRFKVAATTRSVIKMWVMK